MASSATDAHAARIKSQAGSPTPFPQRLRKVIAITVVERRVPTVDGIVVVRAGRRSCSSERNYAGQCGFNGPSRANWITRIPGKSSVSRSW